MSAVVQIKIAIPPRFLPELEAAAAASAVTPPELVGRVVTVPLSAFGSLPAGGKHAAHRLAAAERLIGRAAASAGSHVTTGRYLQSLGAVGRGRVTGPSKTLQPAI